MRRSPACFLGIMLFVLLAGCASARGHALAADPGTCTGRDYVEVKSNRLTAVDVYGFVVAPANNADIRSMTLLGTADQGTTRLPSQGMKLFMFAVPDGTNMAHSGGRAAGVEFRAVCERT
jgi:hypothetical protein